MRLRQIGLLLLELIVIRLGHRNGGHCEHCIESVQFLLRLVFRNRCTFLRAGDLVDIIENPEGIVGTAFGLLVEMLNDIFHHLRHSFRRSHCLFPVNGGNLFIRNAGFIIDGIDVVDPERQDILVIDRIHNGVGVELVAEGLLGGLQPQVTACPCILCENRRAGEPEKMVFLEVLRDGCVHLAEVASVAFVENDHHALLEYRMVLVLLDKDGKLLYGSDNDAVVMVSAVLVPVLQLPLQYGGRRIAVSRAFLETVVFLHRLVVQVFSIDHEKDFVDVGEAGCQLRCLE